MADALWLQRPSSPRTGRVGGRVWWLLLPAVLVVGVEQLLPSLPAPAVGTSASSCGRRPDRTSSPATGHGSRWVIPKALFGILALAYTSQRYRSAWLGIIVQSIQSVIIVGSTLALVLR